MLAKTQHSHKEKVKFIQILYSWFIRISCIGQESIYHSNIVCDINNF